MSDCGKCKHKKTDGLVGCEGPCQKWFHYSCVQLNESDFKVIQKCKNLVFLCDKCKPNWQIDDPAKFASTMNQISENLSLIENSVDSKLKDFATSLESFVENKMSALFTEFVSVKSLMEASLKHITSSPIPSIKSYAAVAENNASIMVKPKNKQNVYETKCDMLKTINPIDSNINLSNIRSAKDGGIIVSCSSSSECDKFKDLAGNMLSDKYEVKEIPSLHPRIKIVGISESFDAEVLTSYIKNQNKDLITGASEFKFLNCVPLKKN